MTIRCPQITEDVLNYRGQWVALSGDLQRVLSHGEDYREVMLAANESDEEYIFPLFVPRENRISM